MRKKLTVRQLIIISSAFIILMFISFIYSFSGKNSLSWVGSHRRHSYITAIFFDGRIILVSFGTSKATTQPWLSRIQSKFAVNPIDSGDKTSWSSIPNMRESYFAGFSIYSYPGFRGVMIPLWFLLAGGNIALLCFGSFALKRRYNVSVIEEPSETTSLSDSLTAPLGYMPTLRNSLVGTYGIVKPAVCAMLTLLTGQVIAFLLGVFLR